MRRMLPDMNIKVLVFLLASVLFTACTQEIPNEDEYIPTPPSKRSLENISVVIGAAGISEGKALHGDEYAQEGEFIHSLHLFIVNENNVIEKHIAFNPEEGNGGDAEYGNLAHYATTIEYIAPGKKTFYAFANMEHARIKQHTFCLDDLLNGEDFNEGKKWKDVSSYSIENLMGSVDVVNHKFIPMSTKQEVNLSVDGQRVTLSLIRLVAKVIIQLANNQGEDAHITKLEMKSFADVTPLFAGTTSKAGNLTYTKVFDPTVVVKDSELSHVLEFYVNETQGTVPFEVLLTINGKEYAGTLAASSLERNHVLPVSLHLLKNSLVLDVEATVAPVGGYPTLVKLGNNALTNNYLLSLPEGCSFTISGRIIGQENGGVAQTSDPVTAWQWTLPDTYRSIITPESALDAQKFAAHLTAMPGQTVRLLFDVTAPQQINNASLTINTIPLQDWDTYYPSGSLEWDENPVWYEAVSLMRK